MIEKMPPNLNPTPTFYCMKVPYLLLLFEKPALFDFAQPRRAVRVPVIELRKGSVTSGSIRIGGCVVVVSPIIT